jgi:hypothetical protein
MAPGCAGLTDAGTNCSVHRFLKGNAKLPGTLFQQSREIIVERQSRPHSRIICASVLMSTHQYFWVSRMENGRAAD